MQSKSRNIMLSVVLFALVSGLSGCGDPIERRFTALCTARENPHYRCSCMFSLLTEDMGTIDEEFVTFVADFLKWNVPKGGVGLDRDGIMLKYEMSPDEYKEVTTKLGTSLNRSFNQCG